MTEGNVEVLQRGLDAFNRRDKAAWLQLCDPEYENVPPDEWPESASIRGSEAVWDFLTSAMEPWEAGGFDIGEIFEVGSDKVVAEWRAELRGRMSGAGVAWRYWHVATFRMGKVVRSEWFAARADALEAAGLSE